MITEMGITCSAEKVGRSTETTEINICPFYHDCPIKGETRRLELALKSFVNVGLNYRLRAPDVGSLEWDGAKWYRE